jgi:hypothetical protein
MQITGWFVLSPSSCAIPKPEHASRPRAIHRLGATVEESALLLWMSAHAEDQPPPGSGADFLGLAITDGSS